MPAASFPIMNDESDPDDVAQAQVRRKPKGVSGRLSMADTIVMLQVIWPYKVIYTPSGQPTVFNQLDSMAFVNVYLTIMAREPEQIKVRMLTHLQELI